jgi:formylglycine-generating enzyme required for sulfatase activity
MTAQPLRWHVPQLDAHACAAGTMTDRERLSLPDRFVMTDLQSRVIDATSTLRCEPVARLVDLIGDAQAELALRIAAGNLLALAGDPRIDPLAPDMITIPGGTVSIGLDPGRIAAVVARLAHLGIVESWIAKEAPHHQVVLKPYRVARYPVTNAEYALFLSDTGHPELPSSWTTRRFPAERANHPVYTVSAQAADAYAAWLARRTGRMFRLPTEAEWEHAAAGPQALEYPWGDRFDPGLCNTAECGLLDTSAVGAFVGGESPYGLSDMGGNVEEYVADDYAPWPGGARVEDHLVQIHGHYRVARGGGFSRFGDLARTRRRHGHNPRSATYAMGFRLAESVA